MKIILTGVEPELVQAWQKFCGDLEDVAVHYGSIFDVQCDAVVSPANSFGFMDAASTCFTAVASDGTFKSVCRN